MRDGLWDSDQKIFANRFANGTFSNRISPTSFYALQTNAPSEEQARTMMVAWLRNSSRFCVGGDDRSDECYWGPPSISADDPAFPPLGYWRGYVWGPMIQLVYWGLENYAEAVPEVKAAKAALADQAGAMFLNMWRRHGHVCENYSPWKNATDCTGDRFYHWGGLAGLAELVEAGF